VSEGAGKKEIRTDRDAGSPVSAADAQRLRALQAARAQQRTQTTEAAPPPSKGSAILLELKKRVLLANKVALKYKAHAAQLTLLVKKTRLQNERLKAQLAQGGPVDDGLRTRVAEQDRQLTEARTQSELAEVNLRRLRTELENLQTQYYLVVADRDGVRAELDAAQLEADQLVAERDALQTDLAELQDLYARAQDQQEVEALRARLEQTKSDLDFLHEELNDRDERLRSLELSSQEARQAAAAQQDESLQVAEQLHQSLEEIAQLKRDGQKRESQYLQLQQQYEHLQLSEEQLLAKIEELKYEHEALQEEDEQSVIDFDNLQTRLLELEAELQQANQSRAHFEKELEQARAKAGGAEQQQAEMVRIQADLDTSNALLVELEIDLHARDQRIEQLLEEVERQKEASHEQAESQTEQQLELEELRLLREDAESDSKLVTSLQEQIDTLRKELSLARSDYDKLRTHSTDNAVLDELREQVAQFQEMLRERDEEHALLLEQLEAQEIRFEALTQKPEGRSAEDLIGSAQLKEKIDSLHDEIRTLNEQKERIERDLQYARGKQDDLTEQLEIKDEINQHLRDDLDDHKDRLETLSLELKQHQTDLQDTRARLKERQAETDESSPEFQKKLTRLEKKAAQTEKDLVDTRARLLEAHNQMEPLETRRARAEAKSSILQRELSDALEQVNQLEQRIRDLEGDSEPPRRKKGKS
jgi:chromosome segregation ATPase